MQRAAASQTPALITGTKTAVGDRGHSPVSPSNWEAAILIGIDKAGGWPAWDRAIVANAFLHGTVHEAGEDLQAAIRAAPEILSLWEKLTPLGRNEFICWVEDAKQPATRRRRIERTRAELLEGKKRPCCWVGCIHRDDKAPSPWQQAVLIDGKAKSRT